MITCNTAYGINPLPSDSTPSYIWEGAPIHTGVALHSSTDYKLRTLLEKK